VKTGLLEHFARAGVLQGLAGFDDTSRERPIAFERLAAALDQENFVALQDERSNAQEGTIGILAANCFALLCR
jgi:hypothetical protein